MLHWPRERTGRAPSFGNRLVTLLGTFEPGALGVVVGAVDFNR